MVGCVPLKSPSSSRAFIRLLISVLLWRFATSVREATGVGSDCLHTLTASSPAPIFGNCESTGLSEKRGKAGIRPVDLFPQTSEALKQWIVLWNQAASSELSQEVCLKATDPSASFSGRCASTFSNVLSGISIKITEVHLLRLLKDYGAFVSSVHEDTGVRAQDIQPAPSWSLDRVDQAFLPLDKQFHFYNLGTGVNVYIIDTGVQISHAEFRYPDGRPGSRASEAYTSLTSGRRGFDCNGHGTHVAGTVGGLTYGPAKNASLYAVRSLECLGNGTITQVIDGLDWLSKNYRPPAVAVLALGGDAQYALDQAAHNLVRAGVPVVVAAGNDGVDACTKSPARDPIVITVAATDTDDQRLWLSPTVASNVGSCVDIWAPGANILSASIRSDTASDYRSGTSQAAPVVAGGIVLYLQNRTDATPGDVMEAVNEWAVPEIVTEPTDSSTDGRHMLNNTKNLLLNIPKSVPTLLYPKNCTIRPGFADDCTINVTLSEEPTSDVSISLRLSDTGRGTVEPSSLYYTPQNFSGTQQVALRYVAAALNTSRSQPFSINFELNSEDSELNGLRSKAWVFDTKGDYFTYPKVISQLPFQEFGNTYGYSNSYNLQCGRTPFVQGGRDVAYYFQPDRDVNVTISLCGNTSQPFNTQLVLLADLNSTNISAVACNDDYCGTQSLLKASLQQNVAYGILIESKFGQFGTYSIQVTEDEGLQILGSIPSPSSVERISENFPQAMLAQANQSSFVVTQVSALAGATPPSPRPAPPPLAVVGTIPGPEVSLGLAPLTYLSDVPGSVPENTTQATVPVPSQNSSFTIAAVLSPTRNAPPPANATVAAAPPPLIVNVISPARQAPPPSSGPLISTSVQQG